MNYYIISLGQIVKSDIEKSVEEFAKIKMENSNLSNFLNKLWFNRSLVKLNLFIDQIWYHSIDKYKQGNISDQEFRQSILNQLGIKNSLVSEDKFKYAWNKMCEMSEANLEEAVRLIKNLSNQTNNKLLIVSTTNKIHYDYIKEQIGTKFEKNINDLDIITSFDMHSLSLDKLICSLISKLGIDQNNNIVTSLHNRITAENINLSNAKFEQKDGSKALNYLTNVLTKADDNSEKHINHQDLDTYQSNELRKRSIKTDEATIER